MEQRVIKFRAWDVHNNRMVYEPDRFEAAFNDDEKLLAPWIFYETWQDREDGIRRSCHIMQFTGLPDKNGKEIYDRDILRFVGGTCHALSCGNYGEHHVVGAILIVKCLLSGWTLCPVSLIDYTTPNLVGHVENYDFWNHHRSLEHVGNIYENKDLLP